jgi:hypothetical protein
VFLTTSFSLPFQYSFMICCCCCCYFGDTHTRAFVLNHGCCNVDKFCFIGGKTIDYGPFGYVDEYNPVAVKSTGSGQYFGVMNQSS